MEEAIRLNITGDCAREAGRILAERLCEFGCGAIVEFGEGGRECAVIVSGPRPSHGAESLGITLDEHDTADFAAEKIIDVLAEKGVVSLETGDYTPEEEEKIRKRLQDLGYIE